MDIYEPVIAEMKAQIEECQRVIVTLEMMRSKGSSTQNGVPATGPQSAPAAFTNDSFFGVTIADGAKKYLAATKKTATARVIADALLAGGFKSAAKNFVENVRSIISRNPMFVAINGEFGLSEWYPGRKVTIKKAASSEQGHAENEPTTEEVDAVIAQVSTEP